MREKGSDFFQGQKVEKFASAKLEKKTFQNETSRGFWYYHDKETYWKVKATIAQLTTRASNKFQTSLQ